MVFLRDIAVLVQNDEALDYCALQIANLCAHGHPCEDLWCPMGISGNIVPDYVVLTVIQPGNYQYMET